MTDFELKIKRLLEKNKKISSFIKDMRIKYSGQNRKQWPVSVLADENPADLWVVTCWNNCWEDNDVLISVDEIILSHDLLLLPVPKRQINNFKLMATTAKNLSSSINYMCMWRITRKVSSPILWSLWRPKDKYILWQVFSPCLTTTRRSSSECSGVSVGRHPPPKKKVKKDISDLQHIISHKNAR